MRKLTEWQMKAIDYFDKPLVVTGMAGTGKSTALSHKIARIFELNDASRILVLSQSEKASLDMRAWVGQIIGDDGRRIRFDQLETVCLEWVRQYSAKLDLHRHFSVFDRTEQQKIALSLFNSHRFAPNDVLLKIRALKRDGILPFSDSATRSQMVHEIQSEFEAYQTYLDLSCAIDREDIIRLAAQLLRSHPDVCEEIASRYRYWVIDQGEDLSSVSLDVVQSLAPFLTHITISADADQAISLDRGDQSVVDAIHSRLDSAEVLQLTTVFRPSNAITEIVMSLRKDQKVFSNNDEFVEKDDQSAVHFLAYDELEEARFVVDEILSIRDDEHWSFNDFGVMYRTASQAFLLEEELRNRGIRYRSVGRNSTNSVTEIRELILYLRALFNPADRPAIGQLLMLPPFLVDEADVDGLLAIIPKTPAGILDLQGMSLPIDSELEAKVTGLIDLLGHWYSEIAEEPNILAATILAKIAEDSGYRSFLEEENTLETLDRIQVIDDFIATIFEAEWSVEQLLNHVAVAALISDDDTSGDAVSLIPLRLAKGYQFRCVIICGLEEGVVPHYSTQLDPLAADGERRLLYIGVSRATHQLIFTSAFRRSLFGREWVDEVSRFILEMPKSRLSCFFSDRLVEVNESPVTQLSQQGFQVKTWLPRAVKTSSNVAPQFQAGDMIQHPNWGRGVVQKSEGDNDKTVLVIQFGDHTRKIMAKYAGIVKI